MCTHKTRRLARLFGEDDKCLVVAMDHAGFMDKVLPGLAQPRETIRAVARAGADAFLLTLGSARLAASALGRAGLWLSVDAQPPPYSIPSSRPRCVSARMESSVWYILIGTRNRTASRISRRLRQLVRGGSYH